MEIHAKGKLDFECVKMVTHLSLYKKLAPKKGFLLWMFLVGILFAAAILDAFFLDGDYALLGFSVVVLIWQCYLYFGLPKSRYKAMAHLQDTVNSYTFGEDAVCVETTGKVYSGASRMEYSMLVKAYESSRYFFLFQNHLQVLVVDKTTITGGTAEDIRMWLLAVLGTKYNLCRY